MKSTKKITIVIAVALIVVGLFISFGGLIAMKFDFTKMNMTNHVTNTYSVDETFANISVEGAECDVRLLPSDDASCKVVCNESDKISHSVTVKNGTLKIERTDRRKWYEHIGIFWGEMEVTVYLPQSRYESLYVLSLSGDIKIPDDFSFSEADIHNTSGDVSFFASVNNDLSVKTVSGEIHVGNTNPKNLQVQSTSGDVEITSVQLQAELKAKTVSGDIELTNIDCENAAAESTSGEVTLTKVIASENIYIQSVSGDVELRRCDADALWIKTTSGDVSGTLLTEKNFITDTVSGDIDVPKSTSGGKCEIKTTSGDIEFEIE